MSLQQQCLPVPQQSRKRRFPAADTLGTVDRTSHCNPEESSTGPGESSDSNEPPTPLVEISSLQSMDGMEYLAFVRRQASELPDVFVSKISLETNVQQQESNSNTRHSSMQQSSTPINGSAAARDYLLSNRLEIIPPPSPCHVPQVSILKEWADETLSNFSSLRTYLQACRGEFKKFLRSDDKIPVPQSKDIYAWHVFCLGDEIRNDMEHNMIHVHIHNNNMNDDLTAVEVDVLLSPYKIPQGGYEPTARLMCQFDQIIIRKLISHHTRYVAAGCIVTVKRIKWIYAILARLDKPLHRDEASVLMELLRELCRVRSRIVLDDDDDGIGDPGCIDVDSQKQLEKENKLDIIKSINVVILLIGAYFEQYSHIEKLLTYHQSEKKGVSG